MRKVFSILLLIFTLTAFVGLSVYLVYDYFHNKLENVTLTITRNSEDGFLDYEKTHETIMKICDTANNNKLFIIIGIVNAVNLTDGVDGLFQIELKAYGKVGEACPNCGTTFKKISVGGRSS